MVNKVTLHPEANEIRNDRTTSFETKKLLIDNLKKESGYQKDENLAKEKRSQHREKQAILENVDHGLNDRFVDRVRKYFYPGYDPFHGQHDESLEEVSEGASEKMKIMLQAKHNSMERYDRLSSGDFEKLQSWKGLNYREESRTKIIYVPGFGEFCDTYKAKTQYDDMRDGREESIEKLKDSKKFKVFAYSIKNCEMMELSDTYKLMNLVAQQLGITDTIDENYINTLFKKYKNEKYPSLELEDPFSRIVRALYVMMNGQWFAIPIFVDGKLLGSINCASSGLVWVKSGYGLFDDVIPFAKISGSVGS